MAEVFKAKAFGVEGFERLVAVKRILPNIAEDEEFIAMFIDEAKIAVQLQHANIAQIFDLGKVEDSFFIALEYVNGRDLRADLRSQPPARRGRCRSRRRAYIVMQVCEGLDYAHNKRDGQGRELHLVHRDISPQNVLIGYEGEVKLIDFGIAKAAGKASKTQAGILKGKFGYMSPEQVRGLPIDRRSDIFAVGIVLYELLTGERLFVGESDFSTLEKVRNVEILPPSSYNRKIPPELERIALKALAKDPEDRYQNAIDLHDDLQAFLYTGGRDLFAQGSRGVDEEKLRRRDRRGQRQAGACSARSRRPRPPRTEVPPPRACGDRDGRAASVAPATRSVGRHGFRDAAALAQPPMAGAQGHLAARRWAGTTKSWTRRSSTRSQRRQPSRRAPTRRELFFEEDGDRTVASEPPPDMLRAATAPEHLVTPPPERGRRSGPRVARRGVAAGPHGARRAADPLPAGARRRCPNRRWSGCRPPIRWAGASAGRPPGISGRCPSGRRPRVAAVLTPRRPPTPATRRARFRALRRGPPSLSSPGHRGAAGRGASPAAAVARRAVRGAGGGGGAGHRRLSGVGYWWSINRAGKLQLTVVPADATVLVDNVKVGDHSPITSRSRPARTWCR